MIEITIKDDCGTLHFEEVNEFPDDYEVWNIGASFPLRNYIPLAKIIDDEKHVDLNSLKMLKTPNDTVAQVARGWAGRISVKRPQYRLYEWLFKDRKEKGCILPMKATDILYEIRNWVVQSSSYLSESTDYAKGYKAGIIQAKEIVKKMIQTEIMGVK